MAHNRSAKTARVPHSAALQSQSEIVDTLYHAAPMFIKFYYTTREIEDRIRRIADDFLGMVGLAEHSGLLFYCLRELIANAQKANTKRLYFKERQLDIFDPEHYRLGMKDFKQVIGDHGRDYFSKLKEYDLCVHLTFRLSRFGLHIRTINPLELLDAERTRIERQNTLAQGIFALGPDASSSDIPDLMSTDEEEGGGLGIMITVAALTQLNGATNYPKIFSTNGLTIAEMDIAMSSSHQEQLDSVRRAFVDYLDRPNILDSEQAFLQRTLETQPQHFVRAIQTIPMGVARLLHHVGQQRAKPSVLLRSLHSQVEAIGRAELLDLIQSWPGLRVSQSERLEHKRRCRASLQQALYTVHLSRIARLGMRDARLAYFGALLADIVGLLLSLTSNNSAIRDYCRAVGIPAQLLDSVLHGLHNDEIAATVAEKWNMPQTLIDAIRYQRSLKQAPQSLRPIVDVVYLAHFLYYPDSMQLYWELLPSGVADRFGITSNRQLAELGARLQRSAEEYLKSEVETDIR